MVIIDFSKLVAVTAEMNRHTYNELEHWTDEQVEEMLLDAEREGNLDPWWVKRHTPAQIAHRLTHG